MRRRSDSVHEEVSIGWTAFLDKLNAERANSSYLKMSSIVKSFGKAVGIPNENELKITLSIFHERGIIVHFKFAEIFRGIVRIKP